MATIVMSADKVIEAAETTIANIMSKRAEDNKQMEDYAIRNSIPGPISKLFGRKTLTREQVVENYCKDIWAFYPSVHAWGDLEKAKNLLKLAQHGDPVTLNENDVRVLF